MNRPAVLAASALVFAAIVFAGCGGGDDTAGPSGAPRLTDPATVPVAERVTEDRTYVLRDNGVIAPSGGTSNVPGGNGGQPTRPSGQTYTVESGDSCSAIAATLGVTLDQLLSANPQIDANCSNLQPGQELQVPGAAPSGGGSSGDDDEPADTPTPTPAPSSGSGTEYTIQSGDICISIANQFDVDVDELVALNNLDCNRLQPGDVITIP